MDQTKPESTGDEEQSKNAALQEAGSEPTDAAADSTSVDSQVASATATSNGSTPLSSSATGTTTGTTQAKSSHGKVGLIAAIACAIVAVVFAALYFTAQVPNDAAAKLNDEYINESEVSSYISQYRSGYSLTDDTAFAQALASQNMTVSSLRINAINQLATTRLINERAAELGVTPSDDDVQKQLDQAKSSLALNDDSTWQQTLQQYGTTEDQLREQYRTNLAQQAVCEKDVPRREATNSEALTMAKSNLAGNEQRHYYRIVFSGDDQTKQAQACAKKIAKASSNGRLSLAAFKKIAAQYPNENNGAYQWTLELDSSSDLAQTLSSLDKGTVSDPESVSEDNAVEIFYCDTTYTFPNSKKIDALKISDVPSSLWKAIKEKAADSLWNSDCSAYIAKLLADAKITYYPIPDDAAYNVDVADASSATSSSSASE